MFSMEHCLPDATHLRIRLLCYDILCMVACTSHSSNSVYICNCMSCAYSNSFLSSGSHWDCVYSGCFSVNMLTFITFPHTCTLPLPTEPACDGQLIIFPAPDGSGCWAAQLWGCPVLLLSQQDMVMSRSPSDMFFADQSPSTFFSET